MKPAAPCVPLLWPGSTVVCLGGGPSLTPADVEYVRSRARVIAINDAFRLAPWADVLYACDAKWWFWHWDKGAKQFAGLKYSLDSSAQRFGSVQILRKGAENGLTRDPAALCLGRNSGYQAINLAIHLGATRVILLGYDMHGGHWFGHHPDQSGPPFNVCLQRFATLVQPLKDAGVEVINCTPKSALTVFPMRPLAEALPPRLVTDDDIAAGQEAAERDMEMRA